MGEVANTLGVNGDSGQKYPANVYSSSDLSRAIGGTSGFSLPGINAPPPQAMQAMPSTQDGGTDAQPVMADNWKPHNRTTLGAIADIGLALLGLPIAPFKHRADAENMQEAMQGFAADPLHAIERIGQLKGHENQALDLYEKYVDDKRQQGSLDRQNNVFDMQKEQLVYNRVAGMMGGANEQTWDKMRQMALGVGQQYKVDVSPYIPEKYDPDSINFMRNGAIKPIDQEKLKESHDYHGDVIDTRQRGQDLTHGDRMRGQDLSHDDRIRGQDITHGDRVDAEAGRNSRHDTPVAKPAARSLMTKYGPGIISKDGTKMTVNRGGKVFGYIHTGKTANGQDNWTPIGEVNVK